MAPWLIITGFDWMIRFINTFHNLAYSQSITSRTPLPWLPRTRSILVLVLQLDYLYSLEAEPQKTSVAQQWTYANHTENTSSSIVVPTARCVATEVILLLPAYSLSGECIYRVVAQQRVYMSQYNRNIYISDHHTKKRRQKYAHAI
jgi:hypothetical protein